MEDAASDGRAVARHDGQVVFVEGGIPGDVAEVFVYKRDKKMLNGRVEQILTPSPMRIDPVCAHFGVCGGCKWQMMDYQDQLRFKEKQVLDAFSRIAKVPVGEIRPILGSPSAYHYRNKLEFTFSAKAWLTREQMDSGDEFEQRVCGFHRPGAFDKIIDVESCHLQRSVINGIRNAIRDFGRENGWTFYNIKERHGFLRNVVFRTSESTGELMVLLIVEDHDPEKIDVLFTLLEARFPEISDLLWMVNKKGNSSFSDLGLIVWKGKSYITERLGGFDFRIHPTSFFQTNPIQAERLYDVVRAYVQGVIPAGKEKIGTLYDLYSGTGSIGIFNSDLAETVAGIEYVEAAVVDARKNAEINQLSHLHYFAGDIRLLIQQLTSDFPTPEVVITDPPRAGMDARVVAALLELAPQHIIYVSCQPATQARDVELLAEKYDVMSMQPVDMFPQTAHVENVAWLKLR